MSQCIGVALQGRLWLTSLPAWTVHYRHYGLICLNEGAQRLCVHNQDSNQWFKIVFEVKPKS